MKIFFSKGKKDVLNLTYMHNNHSGQYAVNYYNAMSQFPFKMKAYLRLLRTRRNKSIVKL